MNNQLKINDMKKSVKYLFLAALVCAMGLFALSCQQTLTPEEQKAKQEQEQAEKAEQFWDVVGQLVAASDYTPDYKGKTFEPVIGIADASDPQTRIVKSNSAAAAAQSFADLVHVDAITESTSSYTWTQEEVGLLTYTKLDGSTAWAEVKVNIPSIPHLSKIVYRSVEQAGVNGSFSYAAYYRFGDVVSRVNSDNITEYWVCVRPAFGPEGKEDSHWMCVGDLPKENYATYTASNGVTYAMPTGLKYSKEHMQNFAEMLYAIGFPEQWESNIVNYSKVGWTGPSGLPIFHDFSKNNIGYHNKAFWKNVAAKWKEKGLDNLVLGIDMEYLKTDLANFGILFLYKGYSWWWSTSNKATVYQAEFVNTPGGVNANMQTASPLSEVKVQMVKNSNPLLDIDDFDVRGKKSIINQKFFGDTRRRYVVRYAKGSDLASDGKSPAVDKPIAGTTEVYRYYRDVLPVDNVKEHTPEITTSAIVNDPKEQNYAQDFTGTGHYTLGSIYRDEEGKNWVVLNIAGRGEDSGIHSTYSEPAPLAELISFEGIGESDGVASPMPTFAQAVRGATYIRHHYGQGRGAFEDEELTKISMRIVKHLVNHCQWNLLDMVQATVGWGDKRNITQAFSVAYSDASISSSTKGQPLFRFLFPISENNANPPYYLWKHYPANPDQVTKKYTQFGNDPIVLQDIANAEKVARYAPDFYARQPLEGSDRERSIRTETDQLALHPSFYEYHRGGQWEEHGDMWNEPVLMFRMDAVYDRGTEYATTTIGGRKLTLVAELEEFAHPENKDELKNSILLAYARKDANNADWADNAFDVDGAHYSVPGWRAAWGK